MMQSANIPLEHLYSTGVQPEHQYSAQEDEMLNLLFNKDQYLQDQQNTQVGALTAKVIKPEITPDLQWKALQDIDNYQNSLKALYTTQKDKRKLSSENLLQAQKLKNDLDFKLSAYHQNTVNFDSTMKSLDEMVAHGYITSEESIQAVNDYRKAAADRNITSNADMPLLSAIVSKYASPRIKAEKINNINKQILQDQELEKKSLENIVGGQQGQHVLNAEQLNQSIADTDPRVLEFLGGSEVAKRKAINFWEKQKASLPNWVQINNAENKPVPKKKYRVQDGELYFTGKTTDGIVMTDEATSDDGKKLVPGDLFVPKKTITKNGKRYISGVTVSKGSITKVGADGSIELSSGANYTPITIPIDDNLKGVVESNFFEYDKEGYPDKSVWGKLNGNKPSPGKKTISGW